MRLFNFFLVAGFLCSLLLSNSVMASCGVTCGNCKVLFESSIYIAHFNANNPPPEECGLSPTLTCELFAQDVFDACDPYADICFDLKDQTKTDCERLDKGSGKCSYYESATAIQGTAATACSACCL